MLVGDYLKNVALEELTVALPDLSGSTSCSNSTLNCSLSVNGLNIADGVIGHFK